MAIQTKAVAFLFRSPDVESGQEGGVEESPCFSLNREIEFVSEIDINGIKEPFRI
jgi:hypothetical protein